MSDFSMTAGDSKVLEVTVTDADGAAVDLSGAQTIRWHMSRSVNSRPATVEKALGAGITVTNGPGGIFSVTLDSADTEDLRGDFVHEAEVIDEDGNVSTVLSGAVTISAALIKPEA